MGVDSHDETDSAEEFQEGRRVRTPQLMPSFLLAVGVAALIALLYFAY